MLVLASIVRSLLARVLLSHMSTRPSYPIILWLRDEIVTRPSIAVIHIVGSSILVMRVELPAVLLELAHTKIITIVLVTTSTRV